MFNQVSLELFPSLRVAGLVSIPCLASLGLILLADIPFFITLILLAIHLIITYRCIRLFGLLNTPSSISIIELQNNQVYLKDTEGIRFKAQLISKGFIFPSFSLLSFECEKGQTESGLMHLKIKNRILGKPRRHLFICRYNAFNSNEYRRLRVWFKFS